MRIFKIGSTIIPEDETIREMTNEQVRDALKMTYPEVAHAKVVERKDGDRTIVEFQARGGRRG